VREALRIVDVDYDGCITRGEMQHFFRSFCVEEALADKFFNALATGGPGGASYHTFVQIVAPFLDLPGVVAHTAASQPSSRPQSARSRPQSGSRSRPPSANRRSLPGVDRPATPREVLEDALSCGSAALPGLESAHSRPAHRVDRLVIEEQGETSRSARSRPCRPLSARRNSKTPREISSSACASPRLPGSAQHSAYKPQATPPLSARERPRSPAPHSVCKDTVESSQPGDVMSQKPGQPYAVAPPPSAGGRGRRPMGISRVAPVVDKVKDPEHFQAEFAKALTQGGEEALSTRGRAVATPCRPSGSRRSCQSP
jgi:hypothetical protein